MIQDTIAILDLGSSENTNVARAIRDLGVYSEIYPHDISLERLKKISGLRGIIVNGGDKNVIAGEKIDISPEVYASEYPMLVVNHESPHKAQDLSAWPEDSGSILNVFLNRCNAEHNWTIENFIADQIKAIQDQVGKEKVLLALSGGVDSSVVAALLLRAIGDQLVCVHVNHGLMRKGESEDVVRVFRDELGMGSNLIYVDASQRFLKKLKGVADPEEKRKIIGNEFVYVFDEEAQKLSGIKYLAQGTIYPDIVESGTKTAKVVKSHHNVGGLPEDMNFELVEPLAQLFKDEVRACGTALGLPHDMVYRQPFPGPGLGVRCLGEITAERLEIVRESDAILREEFAANGLDEKVWQYFTAVPNFKSVGVRDHGRTYEYPVILRAVNTVDAMTATIEEIPWAILKHITDRILNEVKGCNRVLYDLSPKPTATIEWE